MSLPLCVVSACSCKAGSVKLVATALVLAALALPAQASNSGEDTRYLQAHRAAVKYRGLYKRVERSLAKTIRENRRLKRALHQKIAVVGGHPLERAFLCIHSHEGSWTDPNAPYYGGVQMDRQFQATYGPEFLRAFGTADHWPVSVQLTVAIRAYLSGRGFHPWPTTARMCGLI